MSRRRAAPGIRLALRAAATSPVVSLIVVVLAAVIAGAGSAVPALLDDARTATVRAALGALPRASFDLVATLQGAASPDSSSGADPWALPHDTVAAIHRDLPEPLRSAVGDPEVFVVLDGQTSTPLDESPAPSNRVEVALDPGFADRVRIVQGRLPAATSIETAADPVVEVALSEEASAVLAWPLGQRRSLGFADVGMTAELVGVYDAVDPDDEAWAQRPTGLHPSADQLGAADPVHLATAYADPAMLTQLGVWVDQSSTTVWMPLRIGRITGAQATEIGTQLRGFAARPQQFSVRLGSVYEPGLTFRSSAPEVLVEGAARGDAMAAVATLAAVGPLAVAVVAVAMAGRMLASRRVGSVRLARSRGGSVRLLAGLLAVEGLVLGGLGALVGAAVAGAVVGWAGAASTLVPVLVTLTPAVAVPVAALHAAARTARTDLGVADRPTRRRRLLVEAAVVAIAAAVIVLALVRAPGAGPTPMAVAVPLAVFAIGCVVVLRVILPVLTGVEALTARGRGVMALVGPARARRGRTLPLAAVLASLVCVATAVFSGVATATITAGIDASARARTGADLRITAPAFDEAQIAALRALNGVDAAAPVYADAQLPADSKGKWLTVTVLAVDPVELAAVQRGVTDALPLPEALSDTDEVFAVAATGLADDLRDGTLTIHGIDVHVAATAETAAFAPAARWIVVSRENAQRLLGPQPTTSAVLLDLADPAAAHRVAASALDIAGTGARAVIPAQLSAGIAADPSVRAVRVSLVVALIVVTLLLVLATAMTLLRGAPARGRMLGLMAAMGYPRGRELPLVAWEVAPPLLLALPVGIAAGCALPPLLLPAVDLGRFVGGGAAPPLTVPAWLLWATAGAYLLIAALAVAVAAAVAARMTGIIALRRIDEEIET
ncbi:FtsX-like permease family protein [Microbacterium protaetiae]|uniref:FtsX-like permease family protein n=1 Tax=Microbacterium protaetiae TaxID=2509458 RepID=A0A4P6EPL3_9MICO|nr:FtsX-like permease family protein [Microbacterium protaetiae]QAY59918.1 FtsX-like permease family protein [Microbacterium protaetiae]